MSFFENLTGVLAPCMERYGWSFEEALSVIVVNQWFLCFVFGGLTVFLWDRRRDIVHLVKSAFCFLRKFL